MKSADLMQTYFRSNHLGNGRLGEANNYTWTLPNFPSGKSMRCVSRLRYLVYLLYYIVL